MRARNLFALATIGLGLPAVVLAATTVVVTLDDITGQPVVIDYDGEIIEGVAGLMTLDVDGVAVDAYCIDLDNPLDIGTTYEAEVVSLPSEAPWCAVANLLDATDATSGYQAAVVQAAIWELIYGNLFTVDFASSSLPDLGAEVDELLVKVDETCLAGCDGSVALTASTEVFADGFAEATVTVTRDGVPIEGQVLDVTVESGVLVNPADATVTTDPDGSATVELDSEGFAGQVSVTFSTTGRDYTALVPTSSLQQTVAITGETCDLTAEAQAGICVGSVGGIDLGGLPEYLFVFADGSKDANWQASSPGYVGDVAVNGLIADERTSGTVPYAGTIYTNDDTLDKWQDIVDEDINAGQAFASYDEVTLVDELVDDLVDAMAQVDALTVTPGFEAATPDDLDGLDTTDGSADTYVINIVDDFSVKEWIDITGDEGDVFVLRWDEDADPSNGYQGKVKFQSGGAIVPHGGLGAGSFLHVAGDITASGGGDTPPAPFPQGPRLDEGTGDLIAGAEDFDGGGFFTGYWLTTGNDKGETSSMSNARFIGGWYSLTRKFSMTSGTSGVQVCP